MRRLRLARWIVDRYPRTWRERYRDELRTLLDDAPVSGAAIVDLCCGCLSEWKLAIGDPEHHPRVFQFFLGLEIIGRKLIVLFAFLVPTIAAARWLRTNLGPMPEWAHGVLALVPIVFVGILTRNLIRTRRHGPATVYGTFSIGTLVWFIPILSIAMVLAVWGGGLPAIRETRPQITGMSSLWILIWFMSAVHRPRFMLDLAGEMGSRRYLLRWAKLEVARCEGLDLRDSTRAPQLARAQAEVDRLNRELQVIYAAIRERRPLPAELAQAQSS
jgi:hypothetical protein